MFKVDARGGDQQSTFQVKMQPLKNLIVRNDNLPSNFQELVAFYKRLFVAIADCGVLASFLILSFERSSEEEF